MVTSANIIITMTWIPPSFAPQTYQGYHQCHRLCEKTFGPIIPIDLSISSPYTLFDIDPGIYCIVGLNGSESAGLGTHINTTLSSGSVYCILSFTIIMLFSHYLQHLLHLSVISLSHQLRQDT